MKGKRLNTTTKYLIVICSMLLLVNLIMGFVLVSQNKTALKSQINARMLDVSKAAAASIDGDRLKMVTAADTHGELYDEIAGTLILFQENTDLTYIYTIQDLGNDQFGFIIDVDPLDPGAFGEEVVTTDALINASHGVADVDDTAFTDRWGRFYSAYSPVYDSQGNVAGIVGVDFDAQWYESEIAKNNMTIFSITLIAVILGAVIVIVVVSRITGRFKDLYEELSALSEDIETLDNEIVENQDFKELIEEMGEQFETSKPEAPQTELNVDAIGALSDKLKFMHGEMHHYLSVVHKIANTDTMTGIGNRNAYNNKIRAINAQISSGRPSYYVCITEIRQLNSIYDNLGREYGEMVISDIVAILKKSFGTDNLYRVGDGEFVAVVDGEVSTEQITAMTSEFEAKLYDYSTQLEDISISVSKGFAIFDPVLDRDYRDTFKRAENEKH